MSTIDSSPVAEIEDRKSCIVASSSFPLSAVAWRPSDTLRADGGAAVKHRTGLVTRENTHQEMWTISLKEK